MAILTSPMSKAKLIAIAAFALLSAGDVITTYGFVSKWGVEMEGNPLMYWVLVHAGFPGLIACKAFVTAIMYWMRNHMHTWIPVAASVILVPVVCLNAWVAWF